MQTFQFFSPLVKKVNEIKDKTTVEPLPNIIKTIFANVISTGQQKEIDGNQSYDLKNIDKTILNSLFPFQLDAIK